MPIKRIEAVTVCVNYADFLEQTLPWNLKHFDHYVVVTREDDRDTQRLCDRLGVECRITDEMHTNGDAFAKARAIDYGLAHLRGDDWVVHLDADIWLPPTTRQWIDRARPDPTCIYGIDRCNCIGWEAWHQFISRPQLEHHQHAWGYLTNAPPFPLCSRLNLPNYGGFVPIGFFQLWNMGRFPKRRYPLQQGSAEHTDVLHSLQWPAAKRHLLAEIIGVHLESEPTPFGGNWSGRKSRPFKPTPRGHHDRGGHHDGCGSTPAPKPYVR